MRWFGRLAFTIVATPLVDLVRTGAFSSAIAFAFACYGWLLALLPAMLALVLFVLAPVSYGLSRLKAEGAMILAAPILGWSVPHLLLLSAPSRANAEAALPAFLRMGVTCGAVWAVSVLLIHDRPA